jgi:hypothetical protein
MILKGYIEKGEFLFDAIARVAVLAGQNGFEGYSINCRKCDTPYDEKFLCKCMRDRIGECRKEGSIK